MVKRLEEMFCGQEEMYLAQLKGRQQNSQETIQAFAQVIRKLTDSAYAGMPEQSRNRIVRDHFLETYVTEKSEPPCIWRDQQLWKKQCVLPLRRRRSLATERQRYPKFTKDGQNNRRGPNGRSNKLVKEITGEAEFIGETGARKQRGTGISEPQRQKRSSATRIALVQK